MRKKATFPKLPLTKNRTGRETLNQLSYTRASRVSDSDFFFLVTVVFFLDVAESFLEAEFVDGDGRNLPAPSFKTDPKATPTRVLARGVSCVMVRREGFWTVL